ncbi:MAG: hypothetical protein KIS73_23130 [Enhydrobacter sp.]|nr:hypothetical protein [Enhydrobacter sp.]
MNLFKLALFAGAFALASPVAMAQPGPSASTVGSKVSKGGNTTGGTAGSAAAGGTSASTIGLGANANGSSAIGGAGSAAAANGRATSNTKIKENPQMMRAQSRARASDGGTWSRSMSNTKVRHNGDLSSRTKSMSHQPGGKPAMSTSRVR